LGNGLHQRPVGTVSQQKAENPNVHLLQQFVEFLRVDQTRESIYRILPHLPKIFYKLTKII
jgi:hypothetical protein